MNLVCGKSPFSERETKKLEALSHPLIVNNVEYRLRDKTNTRLVRKEKDAENMNSELLATFISIMPKYTGKFASSDETDRKLGGGVDSLEGKEALQRVRALSNH